MSGRTATVQARAVEKIVGLAARSGVDAKSLYAKINFDPRLLADPESRIPFAQLVELYECAAALTGDFDFGLHLGAQVDPTVFDVLGYVAINSSTLGEALSRLARYHFIWTDGATVNLDHENDLVRVRYEYLDANIREARQDTEMTLAAFVALGRLVTQSNLTPREIRFRHQAPPSISEHQRIFRSKLRFSAAANEALFDSSTLALPIIKADSGLVVVLERHAEELLARCPRPHSFIDEVRAATISELNGGDPSLNRIAARLKLSGRTLQRRLAEQQTSHREILDRARRDLALRYIQEREMAICEIAYLLCFSESSAFHRAFKRWTGLTPAAFRSRR